MRYWQMFWTVWLLVAGLSFALITLMVIVRGGRDLRVMFRDLSRQKDTQAEPTDS
jgi:hypothetical protein